MGKKSHQTINDFKVIDKYSKNDTKLSDIIYSKQFVETLYQLILKYN